MANPCRARVWPRPSDRPRQGLPGALESSPARVLPGLFVFWSHVDPWVVNFYVDLHATKHAFSDLGLNVVDGIKALSLKGDGLAGAMQVAPARVLPGGGLARLLLLVLRVSVLVVFCVLSSSASPSPATGVAATARAQVRDTKVPLL